MISLRLRPKTMCFLLLIFCACSFSKPPPEKPKNESTVAALDIGDLQQVVDLYDGASTIAKAVSEASSVYQDILKFLGEPQPNPQQEILNQLTQMRTRFDRIDSELAGINQLLLGLVRLEQQSYYLQQQGEVQTKYGMARTAMDQLNRWLESGRTDSQALQNAQNNSALAANQMRDISAYFFLPRPEGNVFDHRMALPTYVYALTVRMGVVAASQPNFRSSPTFRQEFADHSARLGQIILQMDEKITCDMRGTVDATQRLFRWWGRCTDGTTGSQTDLFASDWIPGGQAELDAITAQERALHRAKLRNSIGITHLMQLNDEVRIAATEPSAIVWSPSAEVANVGGGDNNAVAVSPARGVVSVFWVARDGSIQSSSFDSGADHPSWSAATAVVPAGSVPVYPSYNPITALSPSAGQISLFWVASDNSVRSVEYDGRSPNPRWGTPFVIGPPQPTTGSNVAAMSSVEGYVDIFWENNRAIYTASRSPGAPYYGPIQVTGAADVVSLSAASPQQGYAQVFWVTNDGSIRTTYSNSGSTFWPAPFILAPPRTVDDVRSRMPPIAAATLANGGISLFWLGRLGEIQSSYLVSNGSPQIYYWRGPFPINARGSGMSFPTAVSLPQRGTQLFWLGSDHFLWTTFVDGSSVSPPVPVNAPISRESDLPVSAVSSPAGGFSVFQVLISGSLQTTVYDPHLPPPCIPTTCAAQHANCGWISDGCGSYRPCGHCEWPQQCGWEIPNVCATPSCIPYQCESFSCGVSDDGCGGQLCCGGSICCW